jgi:hypothetical protein
MSNRNDRSINVAVPRAALTRAGYVLATILVAAIIAVVVTLLVRALSPSDSLASQVNASDYQGVFLTNNEVYFGKLDVPGGGNFVYLTHVYRLTATTRSGKPLQRTLVKLTTDIQSPQDQLVINRSQILYVENLSPNGNATRLMNRSGP